MRRQLDEMALVFKKHNISIPTSVGRMSVKKNKMNNTKRKDMH